MAASNNASPTYSDSVRERMTAQKSAAKLMAAGKFQEALPVLKNAVDCYGPHMSLVMDIPACYYMMGDYIQFERYTLKAAEEFETCRPYLSEESFVRSALTLGKLQEELGWFTKALALYEKASELEDQSLSLRFDVYAQRLRLKAFLGIHKDFEKDYRACEKALPAGKGVFALTHALILADLFMGDRGSAEVRLRSLLSRDNDFEKRLVVFDYIAEILSHPAVLQLEETEALKAFTSDLVFAECDSFEQAIWLLLEGTCDLAKTAEMSLIGALKFTFLAQKFASSASEKTSAAIKWTLLLHGLPSESRVHLENRWSVQPAHKDLILTELKNCIELQYAGRTTLYDRESFVGKLLLLFLGRGSAELPVELLCEKLYAEPLKLETADRLRRAVARANIDLAKKLGLDKAFALRKQRLLCGISIARK